MLRKTRFTIDTVPDLTGAEGVEAYADARTARGGAGGFDAPLFTREQIAGLRWEHLRFDGDKLIDASMPDAELFFAPEIIDGQTLWRLEAYCFSEVPQQFRQGQRVKTPHGYGAVLYQRMRAPDYRFPEAVSVNVEGKGPTIYPVEQIEVSR